MIANETSAEGDALPGGGLVVCALDTELLGTGGMRAWRGCEPSLRSVRGRD